MLIRYVVLNSWVLLARCFQPAPYYLLLSLLTHLNPRLLLALLISPLPLLPAL